MRIAVIGSGAMGGSWGARLREGGADVTLLDLDPNLVEAVNTRGLVLETVDGERTVHLPATSDPASVGVVDVIIIFVKTMHTAAVARTAKTMLGPSTLVLTLQNGLGNAETIAKEVGISRVLAGVTYDSAVVLGTGHVRLTNAGATHIGRLDGGPVPAAVLDAISAAGIDVTKADDVASLIWGKVLVNAVFNATCAVTGLRSGEIGAYPPAREFATLVAQETTAVASALGVAMPYTDPVARVMEVAAGAGDAKASMLQDIEAGRRTEVDQINGAIVAAGERAGVPTPFNRALTLLVHMVEERDAARQSKAIEVG